MPWRSVGPEFAAILASAGFKQQTTGGLVSIEVYTLPTGGNWDIEDRDLGEGGQQVEIGLVLREGDGGFIGPVHRAYSPAALSRALPNIVKALAAVPTDDAKLKCPECGSSVLKTGKRGPFLSCTQAKRVRRTYDGMPYKDLKCRGAVSLQALFEYR